MDGRLSLSSISARGVSRWRLLVGWYAAGSVCGGHSRAGLFVEVLAVASRLNTLVHHVDYGWSVGRVWCN